MYGFKSSRESAIETKKQPTNLKPINQTTKTTKPSLPKLCFLSMIGLLSAMLKEQKG